MRPVFDTNILIDYLLGIEAARQELDQFPQARISVLTWIEVLVGASNDEEARQLTEFLNTFERIPLDTAVAEATVLLRRRYRLRLPDAAIWASAQTRDTLLITRNTKDYPGGEPDIRFPYTL